MRIHVYSDISLLLDPGTGNSCAALGSSKTGKTRAMEAVYKNNYRGANYISILFAENNLSRYHKYKKLIVNRGFDDDANLLIKTEHYINAETDNLYEFVNFFDDIIESKHSMTINKLVCSFRNQNISSFMCQQDPMQLSKTNRNNINNVLLFRFNTDDRCLAVIDMYLKDHFNKMGIVGPDDQLAFYKTVTDNHGFIYWNYKREFLTFHRLKIRNIKRKRNATT